MNVLHIDSSPLAGRSVSRDLSARIVASITERLPDVTIVSRDVGLDPPAHAAADILDLVWFKRFDDLTASQVREKVVSDTLITELLAADIIVIGTPTYNFTITTQLKAWFDRVLPSWIDVPLYAGRTGRACGRQESDRGRISRWCLLDRQPVTSRLPSPLSERNSRFHGHRRCGGRAGRRRQRLPGGSGTCARSGTPANRCGAFLCFVFS